MMQNVKTAAYGEGRSSRKMSVSYGEIERAAFAILKSGRRPTVQRIRELLGHGSPQSVLSSLNRFWADLGPRLEGDPAALSRLPSDIADLADGMWQRALALAAQAAKQTDNGARQRLEEIQIENDLRAQSFALREKEFEAAARARAQTLADAQQHLLLVMRTLGREQATVQARDTRIAALECEVADYRQQLAQVIVRAVQNHRSKRAMKKAPVAHSARQRLAPKRKPLASLKRTGRSKVRAGRNKKTPARARG